MKNGIFAAGAAFLLTLVAASPAMADEAVALVDLKFLKETDQAAAVLCFRAFAQEEPDKEDCQVWALQYLWEARIRKVIAGTVPEKRVRVLYGRHALPKKDIRKIVVLLKKLEPGALSDARYQVLESGQRHELVCFRDEAAPREALWKLESADEADGEYAARCFDTDSADQ